MRHIFFLIRVTPLREGHSQVVGVPQLCADSGQKVMNSNLGSPFKGEAKGEGWALSFLCCAQYTLGL